jgi:hypothetical protein
MGFISVVASLQSFACVRLVCCLALISAIAPIAPIAQAQGVVPVRIFSSDFDIEPMSQSSYLNFKQAGVTFHGSTFEWHGSTARSYGRVTSNGQLDLFAGATTYNPGLPLNQATPSLFSFFELQSGGWWRPRTELIRSAEACIVRDPMYPADCFAPGCIHPRKALTADFNADGKPDVFVACTGYDAPPFPGERNKVVLSRPNGTWWVQDASVDVGFFHGASSGDLNGDQYPDVVVAALQPFALINDGFGHFTREDSSLRFPATLQGGYFTIELMDIDGDGLADLVVAGHEHEAAETRIYLNPGGYDFRAVTPVVVPPVPGQGVVLDFALTTAGGQRMLWISRTSNPPPGEPNIYGVNFYASRVIQKVTWPGLVSTIPMQENPGAWVTWLIRGVLPDGRQFVSPDISVTGFQLIQ